MTEVYQDAYALLMEESSAVLEVGCIGERSLMRGSNKAADDKNAMAE